MSHMTTSTFFISLSYHYASWYFNSLLLNRFNSQHCSICRISIIRSSSTIQFPILQYRCGRRQTFTPPLEGRLLIKMAIKEYCNINIAFNLRKYQWRNSLILDDFSLKSFNIYTFNPIFNMLSSLLQSSISIPFWIKSS